LGPAFADEVTQEGSYLTVSLLLSMHVYAPMFLDHPRKGNSFILREDRTL